MFNNLNTTLTIILVLILSLAKQTHATQEIGFIPWCVDKPKAKQCIEGILPVHPSAPYAKTVHVIIESPVRQPKPKPRVKTTERGIALIKQLEGFSPTVYLCSAGKPTIGYGHVVKKGERFKRITEAQAHEMLLEDIAETESIINRSLKRNLTPNQYDSIISIAINAGGYGIARSTLVKKVNRGQFEAAAREFKKWVYVTKRGKKVVSQGLKNRRMAEVNHFKGRWISAAR